MRGTPVWLASLSRRRDGAPKPTPTSLWQPKTRDESAALLRQMIGTAGDPSRERLFRMNITMCLHRACTVEEVAALPEYFHTDPAQDLAGGPVEVLWENEPGLETTKPCTRPIREQFGYNDPLLWFPIDCGTCGPCRARAALDAEYDAKRANAPALLRELRAG